MSVMRIVKRNRHLTDTVCQSIQVLAKQRSECAHQNNRIMSRPTNKTAWISACVAAANFRGSISRKKGRASMWRQAVSKMHCNKTSECSSLCSWLINAFMLVIVLLRGCIEQGGNKIAGDAIESNEVGRSLCMTG